MRCRGRTPSGRRPAYGGGEARGVARPLWQSELEEVYARGRADGEEAERVRGRRMLHDTVLQTLEGIPLLTSTVGVDAATRLRTVAVVARAEAGRLRALLTGGDCGIRRCVVADLDSLVRAQRSRGLPVTLTVTGDVALPDAAAVACRWAVSEALTNAGRHAGATAIAVVVTGEPGGVTVEVIDDGRGFDPDSTRGGFGIPESIVARVAEAGGRATVESMPGVGTTIRLRFAPPPPGSEYTDGC